MSAEITQADAVVYLKELAKEYRRLTGGHVPAEVILVGGGAIVLHHTFRKATNDLDAMIAASDAMGTAISRVSDRFDLPPDWLNTDFQHSASYSEVLRKVSVHCWTFSNVVDIRVVPDVYLIAMKLVSDRDFKHDQSDIVGLLKDNQEQGVPIALKDIEKAVEKLYGRREVVSEQAWTFIEGVIQSGHYAELYEDSVSQEADNQLLMSKGVPMREDRMGSRTEILEELQKRDKKGECE